MLSPLATVHLDTSVPYVDVALGTVVRNFFPLSDGLEDSGSQMAVNVSSPMSFASPPSSPVFSGGEAQQKLWNQ